MGQAIPEVTASGPYLLAIESSCDETAAAVIRGSTRVLSNEVASQIDVHAAFGGVVPELASRHHIVNILPVIRQALGQAAAQDPDFSGLGSLDAVAVTAGPGLVGSLMVGLQAAKALSFARALPLIGVNHLESHLEAVFASLSDEEPETPSGPHCALLVSGGHTMVLDVPERGRYEVLGSTRDDAAGEAFDKVSKMLGLGYPGGPAVSRQAVKGDPSAIAFPRAMRRRDELDMSFSGLKTAVRLYLKDHDVSSDLHLADVCASVQEAIVDTLVDKTMIALRKRGRSRLVVAGGVAANARLRERMAHACAQQGVSLSIPPLALCTDNAAMVAVAAARRFAQGHIDGLALDARARWTPEQTFSISSRP